MYRESASEIIFDAVIRVLLFLIVIVTLYPMYYVLCASFSNSVDLLAYKKILLFPLNFSIKAFARAFTHPLIASGFRNILFILAVSIPLNMLLTLLCGYFMAAKNVMFKKPIIFIIMMTMYFNGGMIPNYLNIRGLGLYNSLWSLVLPVAMSVFNAIICKTAIESVPESLSESAHIDGANDITILFRIILPLIIPTSMVLVLYYGVGHWNAWFNAFLYLRDDIKMPIQNVLRAVLIANSNILNAAAAENDQTNEFAESIKYAAIVITTVPILCVYPFLQKYFVKGVMIGAVKG